MGSKRIHQPLVGSSLQAFWWRSAESPKLCSRKRRRSFGETRDTVDGPQSCTSWCRACSLSHEIYKGFIHPRWWRKTSSLEKVVSHFFWCSIVSCIQAKNHNTKKTKSWPSSHPQAPANPANSPRNCYAAYAKTPESPKEKTMAHIFFHSEPDKKNPLVMFSNFEKTSHIWPVRAQPNSYFFEIRYTEKKSCSAKGIVGLITPALFFDQSLQPRHSVGVTNANPHQELNKAWLSDYEPPLLGPY